MWLWRIIGGIAFGLGAIGLWLPVWPTTIFWILAAFAFARSDPRFAAWIYARPGLGPVIQTFVETGALSRNAKFAALGGMALAAGLIVLLLRSRPIPLAAGLALIAVGAAFVQSRPRAP